MILKRVLPYTKFLLESCVGPGDTVIDATMGNGHDTLFLANLVGENGQVYAFDIQQSALVSTAKKLEENNLEDRVTLILDGHEQAAQYVKKPVSAAIFNLGYLPGGEHSIVTKPTTTIQAIESILSIMKVGGIIVLVVYHGHEGGKVEKDELTAYVRSLPQSYVHVLRYEFINQQNDPPFIIALEKMKESIQK